MRQQRVGYLRFGFETVEVVLREGDGGEFYSCPASGEVARIKVGADYDDWSEVVRVLVHELFEYAMFREKARYEITGDVSKDSGAYVFMFNHAEFSNIAGKVSQALADGLPAVATAWRRWKKERS